MYFEFILNNDYMSLGEKCTMHYKEYSYTRRRQILKTMIKQVLKTAGEVETRQ
jgi:hypothetical protein